MTDSEFEEQRKEVLFYRDKFWLWWYKLITKWIE